MGTAEIQGSLWGAAAEDWSALVEPLSTPLYDAVLDGVGVTAGTHLLDAGCGAGHALQLARRRGATGSGLDASEGLLSIARRRLPGADIRQSALVDLPFEADTFDAITAFNSVQYAADPVTALREVARVAKPGARLAVVTWSPAERCETRVVLAAIGGLLPPPPPVPAVPLPSASPGSSRTLVTAAGLTPKDADEVAVPFVFPNLDTAARGHQSSGPAQRAIQVTGRAAVEAALRDALEPSIQADGTSRHDNAFRYLVATA